MNCLHCYLGKRLKDHNAFSFFYVSKVLDSFSKMDGQKKVTFLGGEPALYKETNRVLDYAKTKGYHVRLDTNGFYDRNLLNHMGLHCCDEISFSLDGSSREIHDALRIKGSYDKVTGSIKFVRKNKTCNIRIITTVTRKNLHDIINVIQLGRNLGVDLVNLHLLSINGNAGYHPELWVSPKDWINLVIRILRIKDIKIRLPLSYLPKDVLTPHFPLIKELTSCEIPEIRRLSFFPDGKVYCCSLLFDTDLNIAEYCFSKEILLMRRNSEFYLARNSNGCIARQYTIEDDEFIPICRFIKVQNYEDRY